MNLNEPLLKRFSLLSFIVIDSLDVSGIDLGLPTEHIVFHGFLHRGDRLHLNVSLGPLDLDSPEVFL